MAESLGNLRSEEFIIGFRRQTGWGFPIALYFFFSGTGAGLFLFSLIFRSPPGILLDLLFLGSGVLILFLDLGSRWRFWKAFAKPGTSWISRGTFLITILFLFDLFYAGMGFPPLPRSVVLLLGFVGILVLIYPGLVISYSPSLACWNSSFIPVLFALHSVTNSLSIGLVIHPDLGAMGQGVILFLLLGLLILLLIGTGVFLVVSYSSSTGSIESAHLLARTRFRNLFLFLGNGVGIILPLFLLLGLLEGFLPRGASSVLCLMRLVGDIGFRYAILKAGVYEPLM